MALRSSEREFRVMAEQNESGVHKTSVIRSKADGLRPCYGVGEFQALKYSLHLVTGPTESF